MYWEYGTEIALTYQMAGRKQGAELSQYRSVSASRIGGRATAAVFLF
jgi:hypothetical protein